MNILHDINKSRIAPEDFIVFIEIEKGSKNKYELDKETGLIILDRVLFTSTHYPMNYGFIPRTHCGDNDPLDVFVLCSEPIEKMSLVRCFPIGVVSMKDSGADDDKIIAIPYGDPQYCNLVDFKDLPSHIFDELLHFLRVYKELENKKVEISNLGGRQDAINIIKKAISAYENKNH